MITYNEVIRKIAKNTVNDYLGGGTEQMPEASMIAMIFEVPEKTVSRCLRISFKTQLEAYYEKHS